MCCDDCFALLARRNTSAAKLWMELCEVQVKSEVFGLIMEDNAYLALLESLGFIVTTDMPDVIVVKVQGHHKDNMGSFFCGGNCRE